VDFAESQRSPGKHPAGLIVVVVLHVLLGYALVSGLARRVVEVALKPVETKIIEDVKPPPPPPPENLPPPPKNMPPPPAFVPPPEVQVAQQPTPAQTITATNVAPPPQDFKISPAPPVVAPPAPARGNGKPFLANASACAPNYPAAATRAEATGTTQIRFTVDAQGRMAKAEIIKSSGPTREHRLLDKTAVDAFGACTFTPGVDENGKPVGGSVEVSYVWKLE